MAAPKPKCIGCHYLGWDGIVKACFNPDDPRHLSGGPQKCSHFESEDKKYQADEPRPYKPKLTVAEFRERLSHL